MTGSSGLAVREYLTTDGRNPFRKWLDALDVAAWARIQARILRFSTGNLGDHKHVGAGVWETRVMFGPGYRIYFGHAGRTLILLLLGGDKASQSGDIPRAQRFWRDYMEATGRGKKK
ncbi:MAG TPA: type II toxin-antitoxin system RelE/ParE family toxin [Vicinamibacterales bacterium]|nr:type II toxin-antitoxin system RelE/ParE family toxin [Vicinamibacterales bacterium]